MSKITLKKGRRKTSVTRNEVRSVVNRLLGNTQDEITRTLVPVKTKSVAKHPATR